LYPALVAPYFDAIVVGDAEGSVGRVYADFVRGHLEPIYVSAPYDPAAVPVPRFDLVATKQLVPFSLEVTRGCPFSCNFCVLSAIGTRHHVRPVSLVMRDLRAARAMLRHLVPVHQRRVVLFMDNNIGGNLAYLRELCAALEGSGLRWGGALTFNVIADPANVRMLSRAGARVLFVGLESFNPLALADMGKFQNVVESTQRVLADCRRNGIHIVSGLMLNPTIDDRAYIDSVPQHLTDCGLRVPSFVSFEAPIPGTPNFLALAAQPTPALLPGAYLRDFTGYTLVTRPQRETVADFVGGYLWLNRTVYAGRRRVAALAHDVPPLFARGFVSTALAETFDTSRRRWRQDPGRTFVAGTDTPPPEDGSVPLTDADFDSEQHRAAVMDPWLVTDEVGRVLPQWLEPVKTFGKRGRISPAALDLAEYS
ncbi:MAG: radical SAM protein, partial [Mycobacteriales bacterium]